MANYARARFRGGRLLELDHLALEVTQVFEALVDRGEAHVRHRIELAQPLEHGAARPSRCSPRAQPHAARSSMSCDQRLDRRRVDRAARDRPLDPDRAASRRRTAPSRPSASPPRAAAPRRARRSCSDARTPGTRAGAAPRRPSSAGRESTTLSSSAEQNGQRIAPPYPVRVGAAAHRGRRRRAATAARQPAGRGARAAVGEPGIAPTRPTRWSPPARSTVPWRASASASTTGRGLGVGSEARRRPSTANRRAARP